MIIDAKPFLKWAGGKGKLLPIINKQLPQGIHKGEIKTYIEPFLGGGAVYFNLNKQYNFDRVILNDTNIELIATYRTVKEKVESLIIELTKLEQTFLTKDVVDRQTMYYEIRTKFNQEKTTIDYTKVDSFVIQHSAHLIFLNKTCFNGLYRENSKGEFNVPFGDYKNPTICDVDNLRNCSFALQRVELISMDFEQLDRYITPDTFIYLDPPYRPLSNTASFNNYHRTPFNDDSQKRLAEWAEKIDAKKALFMLSNSDPKNTDPTDNFFDNLYHSFTIKRVRASRSINSKASNRGAINELIIKNY